MDSSKIKKKINRFRILIIGRANAGKTTILQRVCNTKENPEIFNSAGEKIDAAVLTASRERGEHDIENELAFQTNPGFIFHDSCGFEAGGESEYDKMNKFIADRSKKVDIKDRIHAIWYCIPMDQASRCFTEAETKFFSRCDTGSIPVIVLFTKFDALYATEFTRLTENGMLRKDAKRLAPKHAEDSFANGTQVKSLYDPKTIRRPPKCHVCLPDMNKDDADCGPLIERTAGILDDRVLQQLFVSTQQTNLELCMKYAVEQYLPIICLPRALLTIVQDTCRACCPR
ncbi:GTP-binding protein [Suillus clintonianus]|uniref:GTP-binding protein n=1 Tax=Suillus clintonianus TaxID=1904413 RepID=UPI001B87D761|nr:GTP-binding protein [Suillus clintonianus]KAG2135152.1 GTP-binding protein [Suillus clintonianus]